VVFGLGGQGRGRVAAGVILERKIGFGTLGFVFIMCFSFELDHIVGYAYNILGAIF